MIKLRLKRIAYKDTYTVGKLYIDDIYFCDTIEDKVRELNSIKDKVAGETAIPKGTYKVILNVSPKFKRLLPRLLDVPYFDGILLHRGNEAKDSAGCILVGENKEVGKVLNSTKYEIKLVEILKKDSDIEIVIE